MDSFNLETKDIVIGLILFAASLFVLFRYLYGASTGKLTLAWMNILFVAVVFYRIYRGPEFDKNDLVVFFLVILINISAIMISSDKTIIMICTEKKKTN
jgi:hypothetical protein